MIPYDIILNALKKIKDEEGQVCVNFELCTHIACRSSHAAWEIADSTLRKIKKDAKKLDDYMKREDTLYNENNTT